MTVHVKSREEKNKLLLKNILLLVMFASKNTGRMKGKKK